MAINLHDERALSCADAGRLCQQLGGKSVSPSQVYRWIAKGTITPNGRIYLDHARVGRRIVTTESALVTYFNALAEAHRQPEKNALSKAHLEAEAELDRLGV